MPRSSSQDRLDWVEGPASPIWVETSRGQQRVLPLVVGVIGDFAGQAPQKPLNERRLVEIDRDNFDEVLRRLAPTLRFRVDDAVSQSGLQLAVELQFRSLDDFEPAAVARQVAPLASLLDTRRRLQELLRTARELGAAEAQLDEILKNDRTLAALQKSGLCGQWAERLRTKEAAQPPAAPPTQPPPLGPRPDEPASGGSLLDQILANNPEAAGSPASQPRTLLSEFLDHVMQGAGIRLGDLTSRVAAVIDQLTDRIGQQLRLVMHQPAFQELEASWRGLRMLVTGSDTGPLLKLRLLSARQQELLEDLTAAPNIRASALFRLLHREQELLGGEPLGAVVVDYAFSPADESLRLLMRLAETARLVPCPLIAAAEPALVGVKRFTDLLSIRGVGPRIAAEQAEEQWRAFRQSEAARYVVLTLPRVMGRLPYGSATRPVDEFPFEEAAVAGDGRQQQLAHDDYLWVRGGYYLAARLTAAFVRTGWCTDIRGIGGGLVENLPVHVFVSDDGEIAIKVPTEVALDDKHEMALSRAGFCALMYARGRDMAAFFSVPTAHEPPAAPGQEPALAGRLAAGLDCMLAVVRTAHHVHEQAAAAMREHRDPARAAADVNAWIAQFVADDPGEGAPLAKAVIELTANPDRPGEHLLLCALAPWLNGAAPDAVTVMLELAR